MKYRGKSYHAWLLSSAAATAIMWAGSAAAEDAQFNIAPQPLASALNEFSLQSKQSVLFTTDLAATKSSQGVNGQVEVADALSSLLAGTGLTYRRNGNTFLIVSANDPQSGSAAGDGADAGTVQALIVTAQKREENIQDVPIAMSAFSQEALEKSQIAGGPDLITQVPNMSFTKTNFSSYSIQLRGIGTQAISATTDPAVAVAFNNTPFVRNHFFEQEFYDLQRVEVLRGPQGTLYGRNATAGVVNVISQKPKFTYEAKLSGDVSNYNSTRLEGMINLPLIDDKVALRLAGAWTKRDGYATNQITGNPIDGRDLWSTRLSLRITPTDRIEANLIWEHFNEDDDRLRSGKQVCKTDEVKSFAGFDTSDHYMTLPESGQSLLLSGVQASFSQGCTPSSLYSPDSFQTPNGLSLPYYLPLAALQLPVGLTDPYVSRTQSRDLRMIESTVDPHYRAKADIAELQLRFDLGDNLSLTSETGWMSDFLFSTQDYNRFNTASGAWDPTKDGIQIGSWTDHGILNDQGVFCDPQVGCADRLVLVDLSKATSKQFSQELRLASDFEGPFNFSIGANFLRYNDLDKYYVFINSLTLFSAGRRGANIPDDYYWIPNVTDNYDCLRNGPATPNYANVEQLLGCEYIDPNPIENLNDMGHNYFLSKNPYKLISYAVFGEAYYNITDNLKLTAGLRWTVDKKEAPRIPSWLLAADTVGYPVVEVVRQEWREPTGRLALDWKPDLSFTDQTLLYASFSHGYKAGGANPPPAGAVLYSSTNGDIQKLAAKSVTKPRTFDPEFIDAFEVGSKNTLLDGRATVNLAGFYYDYKDYQISYITDRSAVNLNFDAKVWGLEIEADWRPLENLRLGFKGGYENTRVGDGEKAIDVMDRTAGNDKWAVYRPFPTFANNCVLPKWLFIGQGFNSNPGLVNVGGKGGGNPGGCELAYLTGFDPAAIAPYQFNSGAPNRTNVNYADWSTDPKDYPCWPNDPATGQPAPITNGMNFPGVDPVCLAAMSNNGEGFFKDLSGHALPNAPHYTATITADYTVPLPNQWLMTLHGDFYYQAESWTRIFNDPGYDKLKAYTNINLAAIFTNDDAGWKVMAYVKNVLNKDNITGAFLNSDDTGLTTNVFLNEPRLYGLRVTKDFTGEGWWTGANPNHAGPYPLTIELGGQIQHQDSGAQPLTPGFSSAFTGNMAILEEGQNDDLDWGDGRSVRVTYRPGGDWSVAAGVRYGKANMGTSRRATHNTDPACATVDICAKYAGSTPENDPFYPIHHLLSTFSVVDWADTAARQREEHTIADFQVGKDVGLGALTHSRVAAGLRYAQFKSNSHFDVRGNPDWDMQDNWLKYGATHNHYEAHLDATREFNGLGPSLTWAAGLPLLGNETSGTLSADWDLTAGALFGRQTTTVAGVEKKSFYYQDGFSFLSGISNISPTYVAPPVNVDIRRDKSVTVPVVDLSLGLSYEVQRVKVSTGYRWERYFNAVDAGYAEHKSYDRTIDGPYFKIAVGFGG